MQPAAKVNPDILLKRAIRVASGDDLHFGVLGPCREVRAGTVIANRLPRGIPEQVVQAMTVPARLPSRQERLRPSV